MRTIVDISPRVAVIEWTEEYRFPDDIINKYKEFKEVDKVGAAKPETKKAIEDLGNTEALPTFVLGNISIIAPPGVQVKQTETYFMMVGGEYIKIQQAIEHIRTELGGKKKKLSELQLSPVKV